MLLKKIKKIAKKTGNKLTQNINEKGQLVGVNNTIENVFASKEEVTSADIRKELFEGDIVERGSAVQDAIDRGLVSIPENETTNENEEEKEEENKGLNIQITEKKD